jgi:hypothetical protein
MSNPNVNQYPRQPQQSGEPQADAHKQPGRISPDQQRKDAEQLREQKAAQ